MVDNITPIRSTVRPGSGDYIIEIDGHDIGSHLPEYEARIIESWVEANITELQQLLYRAELHRRLHVVPSLIIDG